MGLSGPLIVQCSPLAVAFFVRKHRENRYENKTQIQFRVSKVPKLEFQHMPAKESHHPYYFRNYYFVS